MTVTCQDLERELDPYIDQELASEPAAAIAAHLESCTACRTRVADRRALGRLVRAVPPHAAPDALRARIVGRIHRSRVQHQWTMWAAAAALVLALGGTLTLLPVSRRGSDPMVGDVVDAHVRSLMATHLFDVESTDQHTVKPWFLGRLDFSPPVVDLASAGFPLIGGRLEYIAGHPAAALVYQRQKHTINVFIWPDANESRTIEDHTARGFHTRHWVQHGTSLWIVSDLNDTELTAFAHALEAQI